MSDPTNPHIKERDTPQWALYQRENFWKQNEKQKPLFNTGKSKILPNDQPYTKALTYLSQIPSKWKKEPKKS